MPSPACRSSMLLTIVALLAATLTGARSLANPPSEIAKKVMPSVVLVTTEDDQGEALARGSGFVVAEGVIATNLHVIRGASWAVHSLFVLERYVICRELARRTSSTFSVEILA